MDRNVKTLAIWGVACVLLFFLSSCEDKIDILDPLDTNEIVFLVSEGEPYTPPTKASEGSTATRPAPLLLLDSEETGEIYLSVTESSIRINSVEIPHTPTRGVPYDENNHITQFDITSYLYPNTTTPFFSKSGLTFDGTNPVFTGYYWPVTNDVQRMTFFGHTTPAAGTFSAPNYELTTDNTQYTGLSGSFNYTLPAPNTSLNKDAVSQSDLVFAIAANRAKSGSGISLKFYHALSSIVFTVGTVPSQFKVGKITIENVHPSGSCVYTHESGDVVDFAWTLPAGTPTTDYTQTFNKEIGSAAENSFINEPSQTFMMIPQTITASANIKIVFYFEDREYTLSKKLSDLTAVWEPGKKYTYRISAIEEVDIELDDDVSADKSVKSNLTITNKGLGRVYVRAMLLGEWFTGTGENEVVVAQWDKDNDGHFTGFNSTDWLYSAKDGFYYYKYPLDKGVTANPLFTSYIIDTSPPILDAELKLYVASQAVIITDVETAWGNIVTKNSSTGELTLK